MIFLKLFKIQPSLTNPLYFKLSTSPSTPDERASSVKPTINIAREQNKYTHNSTASDLNKLLQLKINLRHWKCFLNSSLECGMKLCLFDCAPRMRMFARITWLTFSSARRLLLTAQKIKFLEKDFTLCKRSHRDRYSIAMQLWLNRVLRRRRIHPNRGNIFQLSFTCEQQRASSSDMVRW